MHVSVVTPPERLITVAQAKAFLRVDGDDEDELIGALIDAAQGTIDGPAGWLGRALGRQTLEVAADGFHAHRDVGRLDIWTPLCSGVSPAIRLPYPPLLSVEWVRYTDQSGDEQTVDPQSYFLDTATGTLRPSMFYSWPAAYGGAGAARVRYVAGYEAPPPAALVALRIMVGLLFENRVTAADLRTHATVQSLVGHLRVWSL